MHVWQKAFLSGVLLICFAGICYAGQMERTESSLSIESDNSGILEILVTDKNNKQPLEQVTVDIQPYESNISNRFYTNKDGIAQISLASEQYQIVQIYKDEYKQVKPEKTVTIEKDKTIRLEYTLEGYEKITGVARDENGEPVAGAIVRINPSNTDEQQTDNSGRFSITRISNMLLDEDIPYLLIRHRERNLAATAEFEGDTNNLDIELSPGIILSGKVVDSNSMGIPKAKVELGYRFSSYSLVSRETIIVDEGGNFQITAIAPGYSYAVYAEADGFGSDSVRISTSETPGELVELDAIVLKTANLSVSGIVVDVDGKPVTNAQVYCSGSGQPYHHIQTDESGRFILEKVCAGGIRINASKSGQTRLYGDIETEVGSKDIKIVIREINSGVRSISRQPVSLVGKSLPDFNGININLTQNQIESKNVLVCIFDSQQRPSRNCILELSKRAEGLKSQGVEIVAVQASEIEQATLDEWIEENEIAFSVGMIRDNEQQVKVNWGVKSLPWLILTDTEHIVRAEGFALSELDEQIREAKNVGQ